MQLPVRAESRTGDTPQSRRLRQRERPPDLLMTTPESLALLLSYPDAEKFFASLRCVIIDELHSFATSKRGHHLALCLARLAAVSPQARFVGLSATVADPPELADYLRLRDDEQVEIVLGEPGAPPKVTIVDAQERLPWGGHMGHHAVPEVYNIIRQHKTSIVFVNTRAQAELVFDHLWRINDENLAIGLHHGSLAVEQRRKVEAAMAAGKLRAVVATSLARSRHRLGRRRSRDPDGRAQGREPPDAAHRPRQPPARRAEPRHDRAGQPLRGAGIAGGAGSHRGARARRRSAAAGLPRRAGPAHRRHGLRPADRSRGLLPRGAPRPALSRPAAARTSTTRSTSSPPAATRWRPTSAGTG